MKIYLLPYWATWPEKGNGPSHPSLTSFRTIFSVLPLMFPQTSFVGHLFMLFYTYFQVVLPTSNTRLAPFERQWKQWQQRSCFLFT